jgi:hypothetical protein
MKTLPKIASVLFCLCSVTLVLHAQVPQLLNYQGRVLSGSTNFNGTGQFKFALVNANGSTTYWSNNGSSTAGSEPNAAVSLQVSNGLYTVLLGDTSLPNMTVPIPSSVFNNSDVRLRVWFNDGTNGSQLLTPDQRIVAVGYAMIATNVSDGAITTAKIANSAVTNAKIDNTTVQQRVTGTAPAGSFITGVNANGTVTSAAGNPGTITGVTAGTGLTGGGSSGSVSLGIATGGVGPAQIASGAVTSTQIDSTTVQRRVTGTAPGGSFLTGINQDGTVTSAAGGSSIWSLNGTSAYYNGGNVGIGTMSPQKKLDIADGSGGGANGGNIHVGGYLANGDPKLIHFGDLQGSGLGYVYVGENGADDLLELRAGNFYFNNGNVGIGTNPTSKKLEVAGDTQITGQLGVNHVISGITALVKEIPNDIFTFAVESSTGSTVLTVESSPVSLTVYGNAYKPGGGTWSATSDQRIKKNIQPLAGALDKLEQLRGVSFEWANPQDHADQTARQVGFLAQQVEEVFPHWVTEIPAAAHDKALTPDGKVKTIYLPFEFDALVVEALRELRAEKDERIGALESQNADLQKRLEKLEQRMNQQEAAAR